MIPGFLKEVIIPFKNVEYIYNDSGYIVWREGTGNNVELLHIRTFEKGKGYGRKLVYAMLNTMSPPYYSIFGFTRTSNIEAQNFYAVLGFKLQPIEGVYKDGNGFLFWQSYDLLRKYNAHSICSESRTE